METHTTSDCSSTQECSDVVSAQSQSHSTSLNPDAKQLWSELIPETSPRTPEAGYWHFIPQAFSALRHRNYRLYWLGQVLSLIGTWMQRTAQGWLVTELVLGYASTSRVEALTSWYVGLVTAMSTLPVLFLAGFLGIISDLFDRRKVLILTQVLMAIQAFLLALLTYERIINIPLLIILSLYLGFVMALDIPARQGLIIHMVGKDDLPNAIAINSGVFNGARIIGPAVTGIMLALNFSVADAFFLNAISFIPIIIAILLMRGEFRPESADEDRGSAIKRLVAGGTYLATTPGLRRITIMAGIASLFASPMIALLPAFARYKLLANASEFGFMFTCFGIGAVIGAVSLAALSQRSAQSITLRVGYVFNLGSILIFAFTRSIPLAYLLLAFSGFGFSWAFASTNSIIQLKVPDHLRGRVMGTYSQLFVGFYPIGTLFIGWLGSVIGIDWAIFVGAMLSSLSALFLLTNLGNSNAPSTLNHS